MDRSLDTTRRLLTSQALAWMVSACGGGGSNPAPAATPAPAAPSSIVKPRGTAASAGSTDSAVVNHPQVQGALIRIRWNQIEPSPGVFDFRPIDNQLSLLRAAKKKWSLAVLAGPSAPTWLYASPYNVSPLSIVFRGQPVQVPKFWDATLQTRLAGLAQALAARYKDDASLQLVYLPQMTGNGVEGHFNGNTDTSLSAQGLTEDLWVGAVLQGVTAFSQAFANKPVAIELHYILSSANAGRRVMQAIEADAALLSQVGVALWWISGKTDYQSDLLAAFASFKGSIYAQLIDKAANASSFLNGDFATAFRQAMSLKIKYIEPWDVDFTSHLWDTLLQDFNTYASQ